MPSPIVHSFLLISFAILLMMLPRYKTLYKKIGAIVQFMIASVMAVGFIPGGWGYLERLPDTPTQYDMFWAGWRVTALYGTLFLCFSLGTPLLAWLLKRLFPEIR